ncbi:3-hydroxyacyl-CoA dehydrogenase NAD-binding domain-containing protein [Dactylosporangium sp. NPDC005572]|uniref:3-hydroxyacyl-CoA dehydrogenase NAD-binding domain-containing protein n=1 Tax=Dactylosporangium sp. NPDC005572 TaxID=3156889 RepID=UPI0033A11ACA
MTQDAPADTPHPMFGWDVDADGVVTVTMDDPDQPVNMLNDRFRREFAAVVEHLHAKKDQISGVVITSAKTTFSAGGDLEHLLRATPADAPQMTDLIRGFHRAARRLETLGRPVVAAVNGTALGGGLELALACTRRIGLDTPTLRVGLPEVTFGLLPGGGGVTRTVRLLGLDRALHEVLLTGRAVRAAAALELGLLDELVTDPAQLLPAARRWIAEHPDAVQPWDTAGYTIPGGTPADRRVAADLPALPATLRRQARGPLLPAVRNLVAAAVEGAQVDIDTALLIEARYCVELICGQISTNLIRSRFFDLQAIERGAGRPDGYPTHRATKVAVLGAGMMGAGIAYVCAQAGMEVVLKDVTLEAAERGKAYSERLFDRAVGAGRSTARQRDTVLARILPTVSAADTQGADLLIEAVFEDPDLKQRVIGEVLPYLAPGAVVASNTSTLPITALAEGIPAPGDFIGTHFFSPVDQMPLLEIVVGAKTSDATLARTIDIARQIRKTPIVVNDSRGFFTSRVISQFLDEAVAMVAEGIPAATIEQAATQAGYPIGALALIDQISLTLNRRIRQETVAAARAAGLELSVHPAAAVVDRMIDEFGRAGRAAGAGFYDYVDGRRAGLWPGLATSFGPQKLGNPLFELQERMLFAEAIDAVRCLDEGVLRSVADGNVGSLLGIGFPAWTGGVLQYVNQYEGGPGGFVARGRELAGRYGERFAPPASLVELAAGGGELR